MNKNNNLNGHNVLFIFILIFVLFVYFGKDSHYWGLQEKTAEEILVEAASGNVDPKTLSTHQLDEIRKLINKNPSSYNDGQKSLIEDNTVKNILRDIGLGKINPRNIKLTAQQYKKICALIKLHPEEYNDGQKSLIENDTVKIILRDVGLGIINPRNVKLTAQQYKKICALIKLHPEEYNEAQNYFINKNSSKQILQDVGMGFTNVDSIKLTAQQYKEIKNLIESNPNNYNTGQKMLLTKYIK